MSKASSPCPLPKGEGSKVVQVRTPCRLHFGMFSFGHADRPQFGGVGVMIDPPSVEVILSPSERFEVHGSLSERAKQFVESAAHNWGLNALPACAIDVRSPVDHTGLGVGTQLGLAIAAGLRRYLKLPELPIELLAASVGRGKRSAVGMFGFRQGGLIVDAGKNAGATVGSLAGRAELPGTWRFVLVRPHNKQGLAGANEAAAFGGLPPVPEEVTRTLWQITTDEMLPAVEAADCAAFGDAVYRYGRLAGVCFAAAQGGPFANRQIADLVETIREFGVAGVGQSSWGPTVFAVTANETEAQRWATWISGLDGHAEYDVIVARPNNSGATISASDC
jgi:beta-ribofuranosylaminobenzene 5'-phosphate synthase